MLEAINEKISVITVHNQQTHVIMPYKIRWQGKDYLIKKLGFHHTVRDGRKLLHKFAVSTGAMDFKLSYDTESLIWTLEEVSDGLAA